MSNDIRFVEAPLKIWFDEIDDNEEMYKREYDKLSNIDDDNLGQWLKLAKARGETGESDQVLLTLLVELHRKVDELSAFVKNEKPDFIDLQYNKDIEGIGHEHFKLIEGNLKENVKYYGRIFMPVFPKREVPVFFIGLDSNIAQIYMLHEKDKKDWSFYMNARERAIIREMKALKDGFS
ncbi:MAG: hypothetical protein R3331_02950 [Sulfurospirillaceae bacterium]|nr:hypothetical protein [Sulfurospirillaceae bacterium]